MIIKEVRAKAVRDSRKKKTICVIVETAKSKFKTSAPAGKSTGEHEAKSYARSLEGDINFINKLDSEKINDLKIKRFEDLVRLERLMEGKIGANSLFAFEASFLKALAFENGKELWEFLGKNRKFKMPRPVGNAMGGGLHSKGKKPDFQEFLFIPDGKTFRECVKINRKAYRFCKRLLDADLRNDEGAWRTSFRNENVLKVMVQVRKKIKKKYRRNIDIGLDVAASGFYRYGFYNYKNPVLKLNKKEQIDYLATLIKFYGIFYLEDPLDEDDYKDFKKLLEVAKYEGCLIVGDDLITTNPKRLKKAIKMKAVNGIIVKPNQIGSLLKVKEVVDISKKAGIKIIISHRSGETTDDTIADLCVGFGCDFIKTGIYGKVREAKLKRLIKIERMLKKNNL